MYIGVKLLYKHDGTPQGSLKKRFPAPSSNDSRERSVRKIQQNNLAFQMNATFLEVHQKVLSSLLITKPNMKRGNRIRGRRRPETKRILSQSGFTHFGCHSAVYLREREREREHITTKKKKTYA